MGWVAAIQAVAAVIGAVSAATADGGSVDKENTPQPGGVSGDPGTGPLNTSTAGGDPLQGILAQLGGMPDLSNVATTAQGPAAATNQASQVTPTDPGLQAPGGGGDTEGGDPSADIEGGDNIQNILAAIPAAIAAAGDLLGTSGQQGITQRPAPVAGGRGGGLVGQFAQQPGGQQLNIGQLLAQLPGIR